ncbi:MAG: WYL domain-containing protein, partial [Planctomycetales bacterium]|nr:WYL domain-containing protein [Planctomycetales bacterium]
SEKTIRRDISAFLDAGLPILESTGENGTKYYRLDPAAARADLSFTFDEALALYLSRRYLLPFQGTHLWTATQQAFRKIRASLGEQAIKYVNRFARVVQDSQFAQSDYSAKADIIDALLLGIEDCKVVFITYRSERSTEPVTYDIHPYRFTRHRNSLYLQGLKPDDGELRTWKIDRVENAEVDPMPFTMPSESELDRRLEGAFGVFHSTGAPQVATVRFSRDVARYVSESVWHPSQTVSENDGRVEVTFELSDLTELKAWVLSFGRHAEILAPRSLRDEIAAELQSALTHYTNRDLKKNPP